MQGLVLPMSLAVTISAATGKMHTLETTLSGSNGLLGPVSFSHQYCIAWQEAAEKTRRMVVVAVVSFAEDGARAPRAHAAEDPSSMASERPSSLRNVPEVEPAKTYEGRKTMF